MKPSMKKSSMKPSIRAIQKIIRSFGQPGDWKEKEEKSIAQQLIRISLANGGRIVEDAPLDQATCDQFFQYTVETAIAKVMRERAASLSASPEVPDRLVPTNELSPTWPMLAAQKVAPRINLNTAAARALAAIEGVTPEQANAIIKHRKEHGPFAQVEELEKALDAETVKRIAPNLYAGPPEPNQKSARADLQRFIRQPTFKNYLKLAVHTSTSKAAGEGGIKKKILQEMTEIAERLQSDNHPIFSPLRVTRASDILRMKQIAQFAESLNGQQSGSAAGVTLIDQAAYLYFVANALALATKRIRIVMFFMRFEDDKKHPGRRLFAEIEKAVERGVDVKVILDKDDEGDVFGSRFINRKAFRFFVSKGIPVIFDPANKVIHSKVILIDDRHVIMGSHNWTIGSFFLYDDKSIYVESKELAALVNEQFDQMWLQYPAKRQLAHQLITTFDPALEGLRSAGVFTVGEFLSATGSRQKREKLASKTGVNIEAINAARIDARLAEMQKQMSALSESVPQQVDRLKSDIEKLPAESSIFSVSLDDKGRTLFYLLDADRKIDNLPARLASGESGSLLVCIENREATAIDYDLRIDFNSQLQEETSVRLAAGQKHERLFTIRATEPGAGQPLRFFLLNRADTEKVYGLLNLTIDVV